MMIHKSSFIYLNGQNSILNANTLQSEKTFLAFMEGKDTNRYFLLFLIKKSIDRHFYLKYDQKTITITFNILMEKIYVYYHNTK